MHKRVSAIVQARMGSTRLPNKMMLWLHGEPVIGWIHKRLINAKEIDSVIYAIPDTLENNTLEEYLNTQNAKIYRGSEQDVLNRFYNAAIISKADIIVRVCADNPLISPTQVDHLVKYYSNSTLDYAYNHVPINNNYPDGLGAEITNIATLRRIEHSATHPSHREHVFNFVRENPDLFTIGTFDPVDNFMMQPQLRLDLDSTDDYRRLLQLKLKPDSSDREVVEACLNSHLFLNSR